MSSKLQSVLSSISAGERPMKVDLSNCGLSEFPSELLELADCLEVLNMGGNHLRTLPSEIGAFTKLRILFFAGNDFETIPEELGSIKSLFMLSFKSNKLKTVPSNSLSSSISWLILTDNAIEELPASIGDLSTLRKLMLAGNRLTSLPDELSKCKELELLRIAANRLQKLPPWLFELPRLSWLAFAGNPFEVQFSPPPGSVTEVPWSELSIGERVGEGASGYVHKAVRQSALGSIEVAVKLFKGETTSDGLPEYEMEATEAIGNHASFISVLGRVAGAPNNQLGLVLPLLDTSASAYQILGNPPSFDTITRDTYPPGTAFTLSFVLKVLHDICAGCVHLHSSATRMRGILHGDLYAHNILVHSGTHHALLTDFGAASFKSVATSSGDHCENTGAFSAVQYLRLEQIEVRAFGCLIEDLLERVQTADAPFTEGVLAGLRGLQSQCMSPVVADRPTFDIILASLDMCVGNATLV